MVVVDKIRCPSIEHATYDVQLSLSCKSKPTLLRIVPLSLARILIFVVNLLSFSHRINRQAANKITDFISDLLRIRQSYSVDLLHQSISLARYNLPSSSCRIRSPLLVTPICSYSAC